MARTGNSFCVVVKGVIFVVALVTIVAILEDSQANSINAHGMMNVKPYLDPKRRSEIVDQAFSEQKDVLLDMIHSKKAKLLQNKTEKPTNIIPKHEHVISNNTKATCDKSADLEQMYRNFEELETKLKEVRDKKKKKTHFLEANHTINNSFENNRPCDKNLQNLDVKLKVNGISAIGDTNLQLKHGTGKDSLNLDANGISNIGKVHVEVGVGASSLYIPGLSNLFVGLGCHNCTKLNLTTEHEAEKVNNTRRSEVESNLNETTANTQNITTTLEVTSQGSEVAKNETAQTSANPSSVLPIAVTTVANITANNTV